MRNEILEGDCQELLKKLESNSVPLTLTSPPYDGLRNYEHLPIAKFEKVAAELFRVTELGGVLVWVVRDQITKMGESGTSFEQARIFRALGFRLHNTLIMERYSDRSYCANRYGMPPEFAFVLTKGQPRTFHKLRDRTNKTAGKKVVFHHRLPDGSYRQHPGTVAPFGYRSSIWRYGVGLLTAADPTVRKGHPALMPERMAMDLIRSWSNPTDLVLDPFAGAGTTCAMAVLCHRNYLGFEIDPRYVALARRRLQKVQRLYVEGILRGG